MASAPAFAPLILWTLLVFQSFEFGHSEAFTNVSCFGTEREALLKFRQGLIDHSKRLSSWTSKDCCEWKGVECSKKTGHVFKLDLRNPCLETDIYGDIIGSDQSSLAGFDGNIPHHLGNLSNLQYLDLACFGEGWGWRLKLHLHGPLESLSVNFTSLRFLDLSGNSINSTIPPWFYNFSKLEYLSLSGNSLSGPIPVSLGELSFLRELRLRDNKLSGNIPGSIGRLSNLEVLVITNNSLNGVVSESHFANLTSLTLLGISSNELVLSFDPAWVPPFQLQYIGVTDCYVGPKFPLWLQTQRNISYLRMANARISDEVPNWLSDILLNVEHIDLTNNTLKGPISRMDLNKMPLLGLLGLADNNLSGSIPNSLWAMENLYHLDLARNQLSGTIPSLSPISRMDGNKMPRLIRFYLEGNNLSGSIPNSLCAMENLIHLDLSKNQLSGRLPLCLKKLKALEMISLGDNRLRGQITNYFCHFKQLAVLNLHKNGFDKVLPQCLSNLTELVLLDLSDNDFTGEIPPFGRRFKRLSIINLENNSLTGGIPTQLCQLDSLRFLSLARNNISGSIPLCFNGLLSMVEGIDPTDSLWSYPTIIYVMVHAKRTTRLYDKTLHFFHSIDLSANNLNGEIPKELTRLVQLQNLNLSQNNLSGKIPSNIGNLKNLESLDLSNNGISGRIPPSISSLDFLSCLNLSFNNLSGPIPSSSHLRTVDDESVYRGNDGLCGAPLSKVCPRDGDFHNGGEPNEGNLDIHNWFYAGLGPGFAIGFLGFCSALHFKQSWRISYFQAIDKIIEKLMILGMITTLQFKRAFQES
ncbi:receptor-like protein EIX2 [Eucalyptus grandis]|uniref:receptor-like protein EIX2 n=1 Tax=Eucalyptus grandis TaxID=71139 RepID=UPI00192EF7E0|nr:receptor-like protein EIX2 [Eucalyptus grandis]